ncbi:HAD-IIB family hydrolase [Sphaerochaeta halotolerans]|jgi:sucrose-phosphate synthase|uniref:sucrose-phosphate synthase n=1 Tax=Sphaerochaeta halotolerans TaxID=2293840 RepID=A0A372MJP7_9SPIR|nr:HAD-IIB family hydrolase [Sphaerochaeta halotolerans]RFU96012.1 HAD-IIB family hydrolase [Sphaerochaeta halotolerans]
MYIALINVHGLVRSNNIEMGRDADTGGQTRYVVDLVKELSSREDVEVDLFTRLIKDSRVSEDYRKSIEQIGEHARIVRLTCGGTKYLRKELLWPYLDEYVDNLISFFRTQKRTPDIIHAHYADAGYVATELAAYFQIPLVFTGHSMGRNKLEYLQSQGVSEDKLNQYYHIYTRIEQEERTIRHASLVITSTNYEKNVLYKPYESQDLSKMKVIPPGLDLDTFFPYYHYEIQDPSITEEMKLAQYSMVKELQRFLTNVDKPFILALCRPEARKNIDLLIDVYGKSKELQAIANLVIVAGIRDDITKMEEGEKQVLTDMLLLMDRYDLYGKMAIPKHHNPQRDVPEIYRLAAMKRGIFVSTAALENFGLTFIEASAVGLPFVGTDKGGVRDIYENCESGILVDISNRKAIEEILYTLLTDTEQWQKLSENGVQHIRQVYNWKAHVDTYLSHLKTVLNNKKKQPALATRMGSIEHLLVCDIDNTLTGDRAAADELAKVLEAHHDRVGFAIATGRSFESAQEVLKHYSFPTPDILITAVGSEIHYGSKDVPDKGWTHYIRRRWKPDVIREVLSAFPELEMQNEEGTQRRYKISYTIKEGSEIPSLMERIRTALSEARSMQHLVLSHDTYLDILPYRASKGDAIHYIAWKWGIEASRVLTAGDSGNDRDMFSNPLRSIIVANHEESLNTIRKSKRVFFATKDSAAGVLEGLRHFKVIET